MYHLFSSPDDKLYVGEGGGRHSLYRKGWTCLIYYYCTGLASLSIRIDNNKLKYGFASWWLTDRQ